MGHLGSPFAPGKFWLQKVPNELISALFIIPSWLGVSYRGGGILILSTIFGLLLYGIGNDYIATIDLVLQEQLDCNRMDTHICITNEYPSCGIASFVCVGSIEHTRFDVSPIGQ
jgi:hypothetical protein